jgi:hypothetical protein
VAMRAAILSDRPAR